MRKQEYSVVVAEDEELLLENLIKKINSTSLGFHVVGRAQTGKQALDLIKTFPPDVLITDIRMPMMDGIELLEKVHLSHPTTKLLITSGFSDFEYAKQAISLQVSAYLLKPVDTDELYETLFRIKTQLEMEKEAYNSIFNLSENCTTPEHVVEILKEYLIHNYNTDINLNLIASSINYSSNYLSKIFFQKYGNTPSKYIISLRMQKAQNLLIHNLELSIKQIGEIIGYHDQAYFSRIFKKQLGVSPFDYREENT